MGLRYYTHLSDTHFGAKGVAEVAPRLKSLVDAQLNTMDPLAKVRFIITGDGVDSPSKLNNKQYVDFSEYLESKCGKEPMFVLGNHDVNASGLALLQNNQVLANFAGQYPKLKRVKDMNVIFLLLNSNTDGKLARGEIGAEQMEKVATMLDDIKDLDECTVIAVLHHHLAHVPEALVTGSQRWKKYIPKQLMPLFPDVFIEETTRLRDASEFAQFLNEHGVRFVLHGHKHASFITEYKGINIIACGSSTGVKGKGVKERCLSYNVLTFDEKTLTCDQYSENILGKSTQKTASISFDL